VTTCIVVGSLGHAINDEELWLRS